MRRYFWRQLSSLWFDRYLIFSGAVMNALAVTALVGALIPHPSEKAAKLAQRARIELENPQRCDQLMSNSEFSPDRPVTLQLINGSPVTLTYKEQGIHSRTSEGHSIHMIELQQTGLLFVEVDDKNLIRRCIPHERLECVSAAGSFEKNGDCILSVNLPSDCEVMHGKLSGNLCRVPPHGRILKPLAKASTASKVCLGPDCSQ